MTPIQELIKWIEYILSINHYGDFIESAHVERVTYKKVLSKLKEELLEKEKKAIIEAWNDGYTTYDIQERFELKENLTTAKDYFNNKYNTK